MKFSCEHCGTLIDTDKDKNCPHCGAPYSRNKEYSEAKDYKRKHNDFDLKEREVDIHSKELQNKIVENSLNNVSKVSKFSKVFVVIFILIFLVALFFIVKGALNIKNNREEVYKDLFNIDNSEVKVSYNENGVTDNYEFKCDGIAIYDYDSFFEPEDERGNNEYYDFHIIFKNKSDKLKNLSSIVLTYTDENGNEDVIAKSYSSGMKPDRLEFFAREQVTYTGYITFIVPKYVTDVKLKYDRVTISINDIQSKIK